MFKMIETYELVELETHVNNVAKSYDVEIVSIHTPTDRFGVIRSYVAVLHCTEKPVKAPTQSLNREKFEGRLGFR